MIITLEGGPFDGQEIELPQDNHRPYDYIVVNTIDRAPDSMDEHGNARWDNPPVYLRNDDNPAHYTYSPEGRPQP